jgi:hypothetical protein
MASAKTPFNAEQLRPRLLELHELQTQLRESLDDHLDSSGDSMNAVAARVQMSWVGLNSFHKGERCLSDGSGLRELTKFLGCPQKGSRIAELSQQIDDRYLSLALHTEAVIDMALELIQLQRQSGHSVTVFAAAFGGQEGIVQGVLSGSHQALEQLENLNARQQVSEKIAGLDVLLEVTALAQQALRDTAAEAFRMAAQPLLERAGSKSALAQMLGISRSGLIAAYNGSAGLEQLKHLTELAQQMTGKKPGPDESSQPELTDIGGVTSDDGLPFILTEAAFREIEGVPLVALRQSLRTAVQVTRLLLNIGSQMTDQTARDILRQDLGKELRELELAIRTFGFAHPSELLALYDSQRQQWADGPSDQPTTSPSRKARP